MTSVIEIDNMRPNRFDPPSPCLQVPLNAAVVAEEDTAPKMSMPDVYVGSCFVQGSRAFAT